MKTYPNGPYLATLAQHAGAIMRKNFTLGMKKEWKGDETPVTASDTQINDLVLNRLQEDYPHINFIGEEGSRKVDGAEYTVLCDPVDGTIPFCLGIPVSAFCIAVIKGNTPIAGAIYDPFMDRLWMAEQGKGAWIKTDRDCSWNTVSVSAHSEIKLANLCMIWWHKSDYNLHAVCEKLMSAGGKWINPASIAYFGGLVASGQFEGTIFPGRKGWETAAMQIIVEEAGGKVTDIHGNPMTYGEEGEITGHIISNGHIHDELVRLVGSCH